jgi:diguanylate cyclase (GGDEF)-like protein
LDKSTLTDPLWLERLKKVDFAYQPIVNIHTGNVFGFEALLRYQRDSGFSSIDDLFNQACEEQRLHQVDLYLRHKALSKFARFKKGRRIKLFYNLDNRLFVSKDYSPGITVEMASKLGYDLDDICFEISEKHRFRDNEDASRLFAEYRRQGYKVAVDDCGTGFAGLQLLYYLEPDYIKIDRFFIQNVENDPKKRLVVSTIVNFTHLMGSLVLAEGVETKDEYYLCKEIGCDMLQGYFVQRPQLDINALQLRYEEIAGFSGNERRGSVLKDRPLIASEIQYLPPVYSDCDTITIFDKFREEENTSFFPVINRHGEPEGVIRDTAFKEYIFSKFGRQLLENPSFGRDLSRFVSRIPIADIHLSVEKLIETYTRYNNNEGLLMVDDMKYIGVLSTKALLKIINEKNLRLARNQNPLSQLPGNTLIHEYFSECLSDHQATYHLVYFDFDNFKPFNDTYGFRNGDRLILLFADLLKKIGFSENRFAGHVGGDDFFLGIKGSRQHEVEREMQQLAESFQKNAESFYDKETIEKGYMKAIDREGRMRKIPLITVSIAILELPQGVDRSCTIEDAGNIIAALKKRAKRSDSGIASAGIQAFLCREGTCSLPHDDSESFARIDDPVNANSACASPTRHLASVP